MKADGSSGPAEAIGGALWNILRTSTPLNDSAWAAFLLETPKGVSRCTAILRSEDGAWKLVLVQMSGLTPAIEMKVPRA